MSSVSTTTILSWPDRASPFYAIHYLDTQNDDSPELTAYHSAWWAVNLFLLLEFNSVKQKSLAGVVINPTISNVSHCRVELILSTKFYLNIVYTIIDRSDPSRVDFYTVWIMHTFFDHVVESPVVSCPAT